jgi:NitT/TauT family transport system permease protein
VDSLSEPETLADSQIAPSVYDTPTADGFRVPWMALAPAAAALVVLLMHTFLPNQQVPPDAWYDTLALWQQPFPLLLEIVLLGSLLAFLVQFLWRSLRAVVDEYAPLLAGIVGLLGVWDLITQKFNWMPLPYFPGPNRVLGCIVEDRAELLVGAYHSLVLLISGYTAGVIAGLLTGIVIGWFPRARYWGMPVLKVVGPLPATALIPLVMTLSNESFIPATALIGFAVWFPMTMLTSSGIASVRLTYLDVARTLGAGERYLLFHVALPSALPNIFVGMFMGLGASFLTLIVAEGVGVQAGLGWYLRNHQGTMEYAHMYGVLAIMALFFSTLITLLFRLRTWMLQWQVGVIKW